MLIPTKLPDYTLIHSKKRKSIAIKVSKSGQVSILAPIHITKKEADDIISRHRNWIYQTLDAAKRYQAAFPEPTPEQVQQYITAANEYLPARTQFYSKQMQLTPTSIKITGAKTRFGSCSSQNAICFSWRLMQYPKEAIDYVVVHELAHIVHKNHSKAFYAYVASILPDYKERKKLLEWK